MRESFSDYKKTVESNLINIPFLYAGDVKSSTLHKYSEVKHTPLTSPSFVINCISKIYQMSIDKLFLESKEVILPEESVGKYLSSAENFLDKLEEIGIKPHFIFVSIKSAKLFGLTYNNNQSKPFPNYFYEIERYTGINLDILICPNIIEEDGETILYTSTKPIQSLVYTLQNMDYDIIPLDDNIGKEPHLMSWSHQMNFNFYDCDFSANKIVIKNVSKIRNEKISKILDGD